MKKKGLSVNPRRGFFLRTVCALLLALIAHTPSHAEELRTRFFREVTLGSGMHFQHWSKGDSLKVREFSIPVVFICPLGKRLSLDVVSGSGLATLDRGTSSSLKGLTDTKVRASYIIGDEVAVLTAGVSTPTGRTGLEEDEQEVSNFLAQNALGFRVPNFGQGLDVNVGVAVARKIGEMVFGAGAGYLLKGEFTPRAEGSAYQPGDELSLTAGLDRKVLDGDGKIALDVVYTRYSEDKRAGSRVFQSGDKLLGQALGLLRAGGLDWRVYLVERSKGRNTNYSGPSPRVFSNGNQFEAGLSALRRTSGALAWRVLGDLRMYEDNEFGRGAARIFGVGPGVRFRLSPGRTLDLSIKFARGKIDGATVEGIEASGGFWIRL